MRTPPSRLCILTAFSWLVGQSALGAGASETATFEAAGVSSVKIESAAGAIAIKATDTRQIKVVTTKKKYDAACVLELGPKGDSLRLVNKEPDGAFKECELEITIEMPRELDTDINLGAGDVKIYGLKSDLGFKIGSGDLIVDGAELGEISGATGSGNVTVNGTLAEAEVKVGAGDAEFTLTKAPQSGGLDVKVGTGSARINLPKDAKVRTSFKSGLGTLTNEFTDAPDARFTISGKAGTGDMTVKKL